MIVFDRDLTKTEVDILVIEYILQIAVQRSKRCDDLLFPAVLFDPTL